MNWTVFWILVYFTALVIGFMLSFAPIPGLPFRRSIRLVTGLLAVPIVLGTGRLRVIWIAIFIFESPSVTALSQDFWSQRSDLEAILRMSDEDSALLRIAPTFIDEAGEFRRYMEGDPKARLPKARWDEYRRIYAKNGIKLGSSA